MSDQEKHDEMLAQHIYRCAEISYKMEISRSDSLARSATQTMTAVSVLSIALVTFIAQVERLPERIKNIVVVLYVIVFLLLIGAFILCLLTQYRYKYRTLVSPQSIASQIEMMDQVNPISRRTEIARHYCVSIEDSYLSVRLVNNRATVLMRAATILLIVATTFIGFGIFIVTGIVLFI